MYRAQFSQGRAASHFRSSLLLVAGLTILALLTGGIATVSGAPQDEAPTLTATPTPTSTHTSTPTPLVGERELNILQYVVNNAGMYCQGPFGTPGHRYVLNCYPFMYGTHPTNGYVDGYPSMPDAQANWQARRNNAFAIYPIHLDTAYNGYPAYEAGNTAYPQAYYESYFWGMNWVMGAVSSDDTQFRGAPAVTDAILRAAQALGYLSGGQTTGTPTPTPILITPTYTPTSTPVPPRLLVGHVTWQGRPSQPSALQRLPVTLLLWSDTTPANTFSDSTDASGFFTVTADNLPAGLYNWWLKDPIYLANSGTVQLAGSNVQTTAEMGLMRAGDANNDNIVGGRDFGILRSSFGRVPGHHGYDPRADFNGDNMVGVADMLLLVMNFGTAGAPAP